MNGRAVSKKGMNSMRDCISKRPHILGRACPLWLPFLFCALLCALQLGIAQPSLAETQVVILPYEHDRLPRHAYLRRESPVIRVRFISKDEQSAGAKGQLSL